MTPTSVAPRDWLESLQGSGIRPGLTRMRAVLRALGNPHHRCPSILVAGTNGKGSTSATIASILSAAGYKAGHYTSPHLVDLRERWTIDGEMIPDSLLDESIETLRRGSERAGILPTYFEALTIIAFLAFSAAGCDVFVLEAGLGGRLDATNVVNPIAAVLTAISFDHMEYLGNTLRQIAGEKAGIIHRGAIVVTSNSDPVILEVIRKRARKFSSEVHVLEEEARIEAPFRLTTPRRTYTLTTPLPGRHQRENVALAVLSVEKLEHDFPRLSATAIEQGVATTRWRGRLEEFRIGSKHVVVDGCHNPHGARTIAPEVDAMLGRPRLLVFGIMADKAVDEVAQILLPRFDRVITTEPYRPRSEPAAALAARAEAAGVPAVAIPDPEEALRAALDAEESSIFIGGSLYLAGAAIGFLDRVCRR